MTNNNPVRKAIGVAVGSTFVNPIVETVEYATLVVPSESSDHDDDEFSSFCSFRHYCITVLTVSYEGLISTRW